MTLRREFAGQVLIAVCVLDIVTFALAVGLCGVPIEAESNPLMAAAFAWGGFAGVAALKLAFTALLIALMARVTSRSIWPPFLLGYGISILGAASNLAAIHRFAP